MPGAVGLRAHQRRLVSLRGLPFAYVRYLLVVMIQLLNCSIKRLRSSGGLNSPILTRSVSVIACSVYISPSKVFDFTPATVGTVMMVGHSVARRKSAVTDSRREGRRVVNLSLAAVGE